MITLDGRLAMPNASSGTDRRDSAIPESVTCSIERAVTVLGERWTPLILRELHGGVVRFADIQQRLSIATNLLSTRLATLVGAGVVEKRPYRDAGARTRYEYHLTDAGRDALVVLGALQQWGDRHAPRKAGPAAERRDRRTGALLDVSFTDPEGHAVPLDAVGFVHTGRG
jgi:DNA-binding HxlR family transcriptional regulator